MQPVLAYAAQASAAAFRISSISLRAQRVGCLRGKTRDLRAKTLRLKTGSQSEQAAAAAHVTSPAHGLGEGAQTLRAQIKPGHCVLMEVRDA